jgi:hypothetical protein
MKKMGQFIETYNFDIQYKNAKVRAHTNRDEKIELLGTGVNLELGCIK